MDFEVSGINASLWFARASFDRPLMVIHADLVLVDALVAAPIAAARSRTPRSRRGRRGYFLRP